jgi:CRP-like cAMP-binding protein
MFLSSVRRIVETTRRCLFHFERIDGLVTPGCIDRSAFLGRWFRSGQTLGAQAYQQIRTFARHSATQRIVRLMVDCSYGNPLVATARKISVVMALKQEEIGQIIGTSRETVSRSLGSLRQQHIAEIHDSTLLIHDMAALQRLAS